MGSEFEIIGQKQEQDFELKLFQAGATERIQRGKIREWHIEYAEVSEFAIKFNEVGEKPDNSYQGGNGEFESKEPKKSI